MCDETEEYIFHTKKVNDFVTTRKIILQQTAKMIDA